MLAQAEEMEGKGVGVGVVVVVVYAPSRVFLSSYFIFQMNHKNHFQLAN